MRYASTSESTEDVTGSWALQQETANATADLRNKTLVTLFAVNLWLAATAGSRQDVVAETGLVSALRRWHRHAVRVSFVLQTRAQQLAFFFTPKFCRASSNARSSGER